MKSIVSLFRLATRFAVMPMALVVPFAPLGAFSQSQDRMPGFLSLPDPSPARADSSGALQNPLGLAPIAIADQAARAEAIELARCQVAGRAGDPEAQVRLGVMYFWGQGAPTDWVEARSWFRQAAERGHPVAQTKLGTMCFLGQGGPRDLAEAARWFRRAAGLGEPYAQKCLGAMYAAGQGVDRDLVAAYVWLSRARAGGDPGTAGLFSWVKARLSPAQVQEGERRAAQAPADGDMSESSRRIQ